MHDDDLANDLLNSAQEISDFLGPPWTPRKVYYAAQQKHLPIGQLGNHLISRKSKFWRAIDKELEQAS